MNRKISFWLIAVFIASAAMSNHLQAQGTTFFYQGQLSDGGSAANGNYDLQFTLYDAPTNANLIGGPLTNEAVTVTGGLFTTNIDFGTVFTGTNYWLAIGVRTNGSTNGFTILRPFQPLLPVPYAIFANSASNLIGTLSAAQLSGTLSSTQLSGNYSSPVSFTAQSNYFSGTFTGNGSSLTSLNGSQITAGTVADNRLSSNVALLNGNQTFTGSNYFTSANTFTNRANSFIGSFFGNGLVGWIPVSVTSTQAMPDAGYLLLNSNLSTVILPPTSSLYVGDIVRVSGGGDGGWQVAQNASQSIIGNFSGYGMTTWLNSDAITTPWINMASSSDGSLMAAVANTSAQVYLSTDYGRNWSSSGSGSYVWRSIACSADGSHLIAGQYSGGSLFYSTNYGGSWSSGAGIGTGNWFSIAMSTSGNDAVAVSYDGGIATSTNNGATWQLQSNAQNPANWDCVASSANGTNLVAITTSGQVYLSSNAGYNWTLSAAAVGNGGLDLTGVAISADGTKLAVVAYNSGIYTSANFGKTWQLQSGAPTSAGWESVFMSPDGSKLAAVAYGGGIYTSINFGVNWSKQSAPTSNWAAICSSADGTHLSAAINNGGIYYSSVAAMTSTTVGTNGYLSGPQGSAVELQYLGNGKFMPVSSSGTYWAN
ncbi:MAG: hypothetical protein ABSE48_20515 [Verrucomicrobiota bacterium]